MSSTRLLACVASVWATWSVHDFLQERIFRVPGFRFGIFMAFMLQSMSMLLAFAAKLTEGGMCCDASEHSAQQEEEERERREARLDEEQEKGLLNTEVEDAVSGSKRESPTTWRVMGLYLLLSILIAAANGAATAALNYVSMQTKVLFKSSKIVTVMLIGLLFRRFYRLDEYAYMLLVVLGLASFLLAGSAGALISSLPGVALLGVAIAADSLVPNVQQTLLTSRTKSDVIMHTNWISALLTACYMATTGEAMGAVSFLARRPRVVGLMLLQSLCGYLGILAYLETVKLFGSKVTTIVTSCRKLFTILLSSLAFHHPLTGFHAAGVLSVFLGVILNANHDLRCSRWVALPVLLVMSLLLTVELDAIGAPPVAPDQVASQPSASSSSLWASTLVPWFRSCKAALQVQLL